MLITAGQNRRLHQLLNKLHITDMKGELVYEFTEHRTTHSSQMTYNEAMQLIKSLERNYKNYDQIDKLRKKVISAMIEMWAIDFKTGKADMEFIYWFSLNYIYKKNFNSLTKDELATMIAIIRKKWLPWFYMNKQKNEDFTIKQLKMDIINNYKQNN
jgi:hypothetical protein